MKKLLLLATLPLTAQAAVYQLPTAVLNSNTDSSSQQKESFGITQKDLKQHAIQSITQAISDKDSVTLESSGSGQTISMRGFGDNASANTLVLYNGIPLNGISLAGTDLNLINTHQIQSIQILPGSAGVRLGNNAVGGVISINSQIPNQDQTQITLTQGLPQLTNIAISRAQVLNDQNKVQVSVAANHANPRRHGDKNESAQGKLQFTHHSATNLTQFFVQGVTAKAHYPGALTQNQVNSDRYQGGDYQGRFNDNQVLSHLGVNQTFNHYWSAHLNLSHQQMRGRGTWEYSNESYRENSRSTRFDPSLTFKLGRWSSQIGTTLVRSDYFTTGLNDAKQYEADEYLLNHVQLPGGWKLTLGGRYVMANQSDQIADNRNHFHAWLMTTGIDWQIDSNWHWSLRRAGSFRLPLVDEDSYTRPNTSLKPQTGVSYETALQFTKNGFKQRAELYQLNLNNEIAFAPPVNGGFATNINLPKTKRQGVIIDSKDPINRIWTMQGSLSVMRNHFRDSGKDIPWTSPLLLSLGSDFQFHQHWHYFIQGQYTGKRYGSSDFENSGGAYGQFLMLNTALSYSLKQWNFALRINNLTNRRYYSDVSYSPSTTGFYPAEGINAAFTVSYTS